MDGVMRIRRNRSSSASNFLVRCIRQQFCDWVLIVQVICIFVLLLSFVHFNSLQYSRLNSKRESTNNNVRLRYIRGSTNKDETKVITTKIHEQWITENEQPFNENNVAIDATHLIIVAGHSVTVSGHLEDANVDERDWYLLSYQKGRGLPDAIIGHISAGIVQAAIDPLSLLIFSGGQTRATTGPESEGSSYYRVADAMKLWSYPFITEQNHNTNNSSTTTTFLPNSENNTVTDLTSEQAMNKQYPGGTTIRARTVTEEFATDSFENLLFSICRFYEITGKYPTKITVVSFTFKERRFRTLHIPAIQYPTIQFNYVGYDPSSVTGFNLNESTHGEIENAAKPFELDPYGCNTPVLQQKRKDRNPFYRKHPYDASCPSMYELLHYCGPEIISKDKVPW